MLDAIRIKKPDGTLREDVARDVVAGYTGGAVPEYRKTVVRRYDSRRRVRARPGRPETRGALCACHRPENGPS